MKYILTLFISVIVWAEAPPAGMAAPSILMLNSPCDALNSEYPVRVALKLATLNGQIGKRDQKQIDALVNKLKADAHTIRKSLQECYSAELAYSSSALMNHGTAEAAVKARYDLAKNTAQNLARSLSTPATDGENAFDKTLNQAIAENYENEVKELSRVTNLINVQSLKNNLSEFYAEVVQNSIACRINNRANGSTVCDSVYNRMTEVKQEMKSRVSNTSIPVNKLTSTLKQQGLDQEAIMDKAMKAQIEVMNTKSYSSVVSGWAGWWWYCTGWWWGWGWYYLYAGYYYAAIGNWGAAWWSWGVSNYDFAVSKGCNEQYVLAVDLYKQVQESITKLEAASKEIDQKIMDIGQAMEKTKGRIIALPSNISK